MLVDLRPTGKLRGSFSRSADLVRALARVLNAEARTLAARGAQLWQVDEPFLAGYPEDVSVIAVRIHRALDNFSAENLIINSDCGVAPSLHRSCKVEADSDGRSDYGGPPYPTRSVGAQPAGRTA